NPNNQRPPFQLDGGRLRFIDPRSHNCPLLRPPSYKAGTLQWAAHPPRPACLLCRPHRPRQKSIPSPDEQLLICI
ncbi:hypothetical protein ACMA1I_12430, partial [Pontibacter sp. 13R65]|uniref:hypothetical protein n=1 Tax=Pontibacter sp. 13R65 TaxID=3127458 RepID=UPI00301C39A0